MPYTAFAFLIGSAAISALPPFNGFVSEWLTFQAILLSPQLPQWVLKFLVPAVGGLLALSAALAAACFVKAFGITFLGRARTSVAHDARETDAFSLTAMFALVVALPRRRRSAGLFHRCARSRGPGPGRRADACAIRARVADDRAHRREPQLLQRLAVVRSHRRRGKPRVLRHPSLGVARDPALRPVGLRIPGRESGDAIHRRQLRATDSTRVRDRRCFTRARRSTCRSPETRGPRNCMFISTTACGTPCMRPLPEAVGVTADVLNRVQFLTIRGYLTLVSGALVALLVILAIWQ